MSSLTDLTFFQYIGLAAFGLIAIKISLRLLSNFATFYLGYGSVDFNKYGKWAVVTGCTDGIGKSYAEQLAKRGMSIVLISRTLKKLEKQATELKNKYSNIETLIIAVDFTEQDSIYKTLREKLHNLDIGVLVNNVGMGIGLQYFHNFSQCDKELSDIINCNITSLTKMTAIVLPNMVKKQKGIIINNGSNAGRIPLPIATIYSSTKAYVDFFSRALALEYRSKGIIVQSLCPCFVSTKLSKQKESFFSPDPDTYVRSALKTIKSQSVTNGYLPHNFQGWIFENVIPDLGWIMLKAMESEASKNEKFKKE